MIAWQKFVCSGGSDLADIAMLPYPAILTAGNRACRNLHIFRPNHAIFRSNIVKKGNET